MLQISSTHRYYYYHYWNYYLVSINSIYKYHQLQLLELPAPTNRFFVATVPALVPGFPFVLLVGHLGKGVESQHCLGFM